MGFPLLSILELYRVSALSSEAGESDTFSVECLSPNLLVCVHLVNGFPDKLMMYENGSALDLVN